MAKLKDLCVVTGTYEKDGQTKKRYQTIGALMSSNDGGQYILLDPVINLAAIPRQDGRDRVMVSLFDVKEKPVYGDDVYKAQMQPLDKTPPKASGGIDDDIPF